MVMRAAGGIQRSTVRPTGTIGGVDHPLLKSIISWAGGREDVRAVILSGSRARTDRSADAVSDFDVELYVRQPELFEDAGWLDEIAPVLVTVEDEFEGDRTQLVFFEGPEKVDFQIRPLAVLDELAAELDDLHQRGFLVLLDRDGSAARLPAPRGAEPVATPDSDDLLDVCSEFYFEAAHVPRYLARGELWQAELRLANARAELLRLVEWHAAVTSEQPVDVRHQGIGVHRWVAPWIHDRLPGTFATLDRDDLLRALNALAELFVEVSHVVAAEGAVSHPTVLERALRPYLRQLPILV